ncbi:hypothetical protein [Cupriavidus necator]
MREESVGRIGEARPMQHFASVEDTACCADLDRHNMQVFAAANALHDLVGNQQCRSLADALDSDTQRPYQSGLRPRALSKASALMPLAAGAKVI